MGKPAPNAGYYGGTRPQRGILWDVVKDIEKATAGYLDDLLYNYITVMIT
jgi:hypothetical protein